LVFLKKLLVCLVCLTLVASLTSSAFAITVTVPESFWSDLEEELTEEWIPDGIELGISKDKLKKLEKGKPAYDKEDILIYDNDYGFSGTKYVRSYIFANKKLGMIVCEFEPSMFSFVQYKRILVDLDELYENKRISGNQGDAPTELWINKSSEGTPPQEAVWNGDLALADLWIVDNTRIMLSLKLDDNGEVQLRVTFFGSDE